MFEFKSFIFHRLGKEYKINFYDNSILKDFYQMKIFEKTNGRFFKYRCIDEDEVLLDYYTSVKYKDLREYAERRLYKTIQKLDERERRENAFDRFINSEG